MATDKSKAAKPKAVKPRKAPNRFGLAMHRLYGGETSFDFIRRRKIWYLLSLLIMLGSIAGIGIKNFNLGIEFVGGTQFQGPVVDGVSLDEVTEAVESEGVEVATTQTAGSGADASFLVRTEALPNDKQTQIQDTISEVLNGKAVSVSQVSNSWGASVSQQAIIALVVTLLLIAGYLWWRYERKMAGAAIIALIHDLVLTAGIYALVGFEVTPSTVIGMLTILGYSLYDTVVVFDKVDENTRGVLNQQRYTYGESANLAVNQTLMRSINTTLIGLLPVAGLLFVGAGMLGVGTLKDLSLVLFVGMATGGYSSLFLATPMVVDFRLREKNLKSHTRRVLAKRAELGEPAEPIVAQAPDDEADDADDEPAEPEPERETEVDSDDEDDEPDEPKSRPKALTAAGPRPGARPAKRASAGKKRKRR